MSEPPPGFVLITKSTGRLGAVPAMGPAAAPPCAAGAVVATPPAAGFAAGAEAGLDAAGALPSGCDRRGGPDEQAAATSAATSRTTADRTWKHLMGLDLLVLQAQRRSGRGHRLWSQHRGLRQPPPNRRRLGCTLR